MMIKIFIQILVLTVMAVPAAFATPIGKEEANNYYASCKSKQDERMLPETQDAFCACTSVMMMKNMSVEDVQVMRGNDQPGRDMLNKMLLDVYAPCMSYPVQDMVIGSCMNDPNIDKAGLKMPKEKLCVCMAQKTAEWFTKEGRGLMASILKQNPNVYDPISPVMESREFKSASYNSMTACMTGGK